MLEIICKKCDTVHRYEISDNCSKCENSFYDTINPPEQKKSYKLTTALFAITFASGIIIDNVVFDSDNNVQANPDEIYTLYAGMSQCIAQKSRLSNSASNNNQYNVFAKDCAKIISNK